MMAVYVIECAGLLKIGYSEDPARRTANLFKSGSRYTAPKAAHNARGTQRLAFVIEGATKQDERSIHDALKDYGIGCEWFVDEPEVWTLLRGFALDGLPDPIARPGGSAWHSLPPGERGGCNADPVVSLLERRSRAA